MNIPLENAINFCGTPAKLASLAQVSHQAIIFWRNGQRRMTAESAIKIEAATGGAVTRYQLRPDIFSQLPATQSTQTQEVA